MSNLDPQQQGRITALVPDLLGPIPTGWAMPCAPVAGIAAGFYAIPPIGSGVWIEFEKGDPDYPIWTGCFYGSAAEVPALALTVPDNVPERDDIIISAFAVVTFSIFVQGLTMSPLIRRLGVQAR